MTDAPAHPRAQVRQAVAALLKGTKEAPGTGAKGQVYDSRDFPLSEKSLPAILVYSVSEEFDRTHMGDDGIRRRVMTLRVEAYQTGEDAAEDADTLSGEVERVFADNPTLGDKVESARLLQTEFFALEGAQISISAAVMEAEVVYWTAPDEADPPRPRLFFGFDPEIGPGNEDRYIEVGTGDYLPDV